MNSVYILGYGTTAYILALLLNKDTIYVSDKDIERSTDNLNMSNVITMKLEVLSKEENEFLKSKIDFSDCIVHKKAGYRYGGRIYDDATPEMINNYLSKQNRDVTFDFKFETEFDAIDLNKMIQKYKKNIKILSEDLLPKRDATFLITNHQLNRVTNDTSEYILKTKNEMQGHSYIYDCDLYSNVKRYSEDMNECINPIIGSKEVKNYYEKPKIFYEYDIKKNTESYWIGRFASKTRMEQIDVLRFCMKLINERK